MWPARGDRWYAVVYEGLDPVTGKPTDQELPTLSELLIPADIRRSAGAGNAQSEAFLARLRRAQGFGILTGLGTVLSGVALAWLVGVESVGPGVWVGAGLVAAAIALGAIIARPASRRLVDAVQAGDRVGANRAGAQVGWVLEIESVLWLGALIAMVW